MGAQLVTLPSKGPNSPFSSGNRTLVARTCATCGQLADGDSFPLINRGMGGRRKHCHKCHNARKKRDREERGIGVPGPRPALPLQFSAWEKWTAEDDKVLRENVGVLGYEVVAVMLGRSLRSVYKRREILGLAPVRVKHRVDKPWRVQKRA
jgi:hypothetical protein